MEAGDLPVGEKDRDQHGVNQVYWSLEVIFDGINRILLCSG
jgi:hypothetical protein